MKTAKVQEHPTRSVGGKVALRQLCTLLILSFSGAKKALGAALSYSNCSDATKGQIYNLNLLQNRHCALHKNLIPSPAGSTPLH